MLRQRSVLKSATISYRGEKQVGLFCSSKCIGGSKHSKKLKRNEYIRQHMQFCDLKMLSCCGTFHDEISGFESLIYVMNYQL